LTSGSGECVSGHEGEAQIGAFVWTS
jgi:hypothetical protein